MITCVSFGLGLCHVVLDGFGFHQNWGSKHIFDCSSCGQNQYYWRIASKQLEFCLILIYIVPHWLKWLGWFLELAIFGQEYTAL